MKAFLAAAVLGMSAGVAAAQEFVAPHAPSNIPVVPGPQVAPPPAVEGIVAKIFNVQKPWLLVSPLAPKSYGNGQTNGTVAASEADPGKPKGFILFGLEFW